MQQSLVNWFKLAKPNGNSLLISGSEETLPLINNLVEYCQEKLSNFTHSFKYVADRYFNLQEIRNILLSNSLFDDKNIFVLSFKTKPTQEQQKQLELIFPLLDENNFLCLSCDKLDKKELNAPWLSLFKEQGDILFLSGTPEESCVWVESLFKKNNFTLEAEAMDLLLSLNQGNLAGLYQEVNKLCLLFKAPYQITLADAKSNLLENSLYNIFELSNAYLTGKNALTVEIFNNICQSTTEAILIIWNVGEDLRKLIKIKNNLRQNPNFSLAISDLRIWINETVIAFQAANQRLSYPTLLAYLDQLAKIDLLIKGVTNSGDALVALERLLINIAQGAQRF